MEKVVKTQEASQKCLVTEPSEENITKRWEQLM